MKASQKLGEKIFEMSVSNKGLKFITYLRFHRKKKNSENSILKWSKEQALNKKNIQMDNKQIKTYSALLLNSEMKT